MRNRGRHPLCRILFAATANYDEPVLKITSVNRIAGFDPREA
jgi:hypothetical protein